MRAAKAATEALRDRLSVPLLCQGDDSTMLLVKQFAEDEPTCLFGTLSLWQGVDVPGPSLRLVIIDRIPFPRPDDPLAPPASATSPPRAATASWRSPPPTPRCCSPRARAACCAASTTRAWSRSSIPGWRRPATASFLGLAAALLAHQRPGEGPRRPQAPRRRADLTTLFLSRATERGSPREAWQESPALL